MTKNEVRKFHSILEARVIELNRSTRQRDAIVIEKSADQLESMLGRADRELAGRSLEIESARLRESRAALRRIQDGTYGICEECDEPIGAKRLAAIPSAALCIRCQNVRDREGASYARPTFALAA